MAMQQQDVSCHDDNDSTEEEPMGMADSLMKRGDFLRQLRMLELADQAERDNLQDDSSHHPDDAVDVLPNKQRVLRYDSYLAHQRYYDDLKHVDCDYIDYGTIGGSGRLVIEQEKHLGKGGLVSAV